VLAASNVLQFSLRLNTNNPTVSLRKLSYLQKLHANSRVAAGGDLYDDLIERTQSAVSRTFSKEDLESVGLRTDQDLKSRIDQILKAGVVWENATSFVTRHAYFFRSAPRLLQETVPKKLKSLLSDPHLKVSLAETIRTQMLSHLALHEQDPSSMTASTLTAAVEATSLAAAKAISEAKPDLPQASSPSGEDDDGNANKLAYGCVMHFLRLWITGGHGGPSMATTMAILGPQVCLQRLSEQKSLD
jgi:hypothetical protein